MIPSKLFDDEYLGTRKYYFDLLADFGPVVQVSPDDREVYKDLLKACSLLVLPGGLDLNPMRYEQAPSVYSSNLDPFLEYYDKVLLPVALELGVPVLGICRGFQSLLVHFGGSLVQDLPDHPRSENWGDLVHPVERTLPDGTKSITSLNSLHHQGQFIDQIPEQLTVIAVSIKDKICEAFVNKDYRVLGVQWHPEVLLTDAWITEWLNVIMS